VAVTKLSVALDERVASAARAAATRDGMSLSAWLSRAAEQAVRTDEGLRAVVEWEAEHSPITAAERAAADALLDTLAARQRAAAS
jgi:hypothetical protein